MTIKQIELQKYQEVINKAKEAWADAAAVEFLTHGDAGPITIGDGIEIMAIPNRCRLPQSISLISSNEVCYAQGCHHYEATAKVALDILKAAGLDVWYNYGRMD